MSFNMSPRNNSANSLMGFTVHQPSLGAPLQFFPAMGSKQLDDMIDAYVPGYASIPEKRTIVSLEFCGYAAATGDNFKYFMVYPSLASSATNSPASSSTMYDSAYGSSFDTSPVISEIQWTQPTNASSASRSKSRLSKKKSAPATDLAHIPGMKIMTKDGRDVTNSASRGCKTKEQREHAHLMRMMKACESCRKKKIRCDPSHKRTAESSSASAKTTKKAKGTHPVAVPQPFDTQESPFTAPFDSAMTDSSSSFTSYMTETINPSDSVSSELMDWDQFIKYDDEPTESIPYDYDFLFDPAGHLSPAVSSTFTTSSTSPSQQPLTPIQAVGPEPRIKSDEGISASALREEGLHASSLPYLNPGGRLGGNNNYVDFNLYSPDSSFCLDDNLGLMTEMAASPGPDYSTYVSSQQSRSDRNRHSRRDSGQHATADQFGSQSCVNLASERGILHEREEFSSNTLEGRSFYEGSNFRPLLDGISSTQQGERLLGERIWTPRGASAIHDGESRHSTGRLRSQSSEELSGFGTWSSEHSLQSVPGPNQPVTLQSISPFAASGEDGPRRAALASSSAANLGSPTRNQSSKIEASSSIADQVSPSASAFSSASPSPTVPSKLSIAIGQSGTKAQTHVALQKPIFGSITTTVTTTQSVTRSASCGEQSLQAFNAQRPNSAAEYGRTMGDTSGSVRILPEGVLEQKPVDSNVSIPYLTTSSLASSWLAKLVVLATLLVGFSPMFATVWSWTRESSPRTLSPFHMTLVSLFVLLNSIKENTQQDPLMWISAGVMATVVATATLPLSESGLLRTDSGADTKSAHTPLSIAPYIYTPTSDYVKSKTSSIAEVFSRARCGLLRRFPSASGPATMAKPSLHRYFTPC